MELFNLFAKLVLESSEFKSGVAEAQGIAEDLSDSIEEAGGSFDSLSSAMIESGGTASENFEALAELDAEYYKSQQEIARLEDALSELDDGSGELTGSMQELNDMLEAEREHSADLKEQMDQLVNSTQKEAEEQDKANRSSDNASSSLKKYEAAVKKLKSAIQGLLAYKIAKWFWDTTDAVAQFGDHIDKASQKMNMSAKTYQEWSFIAERDGANIDSLTMSMRTLTTQAAKQSDAFEQLGMSYKDIQSMSPEQLFEATVKALQNVEDKTQRTVLATELLGRGATELMPLFNAASGEIDGLKNRIAELGGIMSDKAVKQSAAYQDALTDLQTAAQGVKNRIASVFMEFNTDVINTIANVMGAFNRAIDAVTFDSYEEELEAVTGRLDAAKASMERMKEEGIDSGPVWDATAAQVEKYEARIQKLNELIPETTDSMQDQQSALADLASSYQETFDAVSESFESWFGVFDQATTDVTVKFEDMVSNLESQLTFWENYEASIHTLADAGFGDLVTAIQGMGPAGYQYAQVLAGMVDSGDEGVAKLNELQDTLQKVDEARNEAAETTTDIKFEDNSEETISHIKEVLNELRSTDGASASVYTYHYDVYGGGNWARGAGGRAGGISYVPYHNYPAMLHEGERVLTKEENKQYNNQAERPQNNKPIQLFIETPIQIDGATIARKTYQFLLDLNDAHGAKLINA